MGGVAKAVGSVISAVGKGVGTVLGSLGGKKRKTPSPKALMASVPKPDQNCTKTCIICITIWWFNYIDRRRRFR